jgi:hypothetical protein
MHTAIERLMLCMRDRVCGEVVATDGERGI